MFTKKDTNIFGVPLIALIVTYLIYKNSSSVQKDTFITKLKNDTIGLEDIPSQEHNIGCQLPTKDNPFMNTPFFDVAADKKLPKSCTSYDNKGVQRQIEKKFETGFVS